MTDNRCIVVLSLILILMAGGTSKAQGPLPKIQENAAGKEAARQPEAPKPEAPRPIVNIALENERLSVELVDASMGDIIQAIAHKAGFSVEGDSAALSKKLTTRFNNLDVDRGIARLFSLAKETNYLINYDSKGAVSKLEIYGGAVASSAAKAPSAAPQAPTSRRQVMPPAQPATTRPVINRPLPPAARPVPQVRPLRPAPQVPAVRQAPQPPQPPEPAPADSTPTQTLQEDQHTEEPQTSEDVKEIPYVPPQRKPVYIPPIKH